MNQLCCNNKSVQGAAWAAAEHGRGNFPSGPPPGKACRQLLSTVTPAHWHHKISQQAVQQTVPTLQDAAAWAQQCQDHRLAGPLGPQQAAHRLNRWHCMHLQLLTSRHCPRGIGHSFQGSLCPFTFSASCKQSQELSQHTFHLAKGSINNSVCLLTTSCITATLGTGSHPKTRWLRAFKFATYFKSSTPYQPLCLFKAQFCSAHWSTRMPIEELRKWRDGWFIPQPFPPTHRDLQLKWRISCTIAAHKTTWCNRGTPLCPLPGQMLSCTCSDAAPLFSL